MHFQDHGRRKVEADFDGGRVSSDGDLLRDALLAMAVGREDVEGKERRRESDKGKAPASSSTLNRMELTPEDANAGARHKKYCLPSG
ncbi:MAG: hypothetical protein ACLFTT_18685 [Candidatus Hydrogenedentota bacterium]